MNIYHGTSVKHFDSIMKHGLLFKRENSNWNHTFVSVENMIYLSTCYSTYFAIAACKEKEDLLLVEVNFDNLKKTKIYPDEDFIAQAIVNDFSSLEDAHKNVLENFKQYKKHWKLSLEKFGNIAYNDNINNIERVCIIPRSSKVLSSIDPTITIINHCFFGQYYENITKWVFGDIDEFPSQFPKELFSSLPKIQIEQINKMNEIFKKERENFKIIKKKNYV